MSNEFQLDRDSLSLINEFLTHNESSRSRKISRDFRDSVDYKIRYEQKAVNISNIYQVGEHNKLGLLLDKYSTDIRHLKNIAELYGSFDLLPLSESEYNLLKFDKIIRYSCNYSKPFYSFPKIVNYSISSNDYNIYENMNIREYKIISKTETRLDFHFIHRQDSVDYNIYIEYIIKDNEKFTEIIRYEDDEDEMNGIGKYVDMFILYNENIFICIYRVDEKLYQYSFFKFSDIKTVNCYLFNNFPVFDYLTDEEEHIVVNILHNSNLKNNYYIFNNFVLNLDTQEIKVIGDYNGKYIIDKNILDKIEDSDNLLKMAEY